MDWEATPASDSVATPTDDRDDREDSPQSNDDAIYCICRKPYRDEPDDVLMIGCEACDNWFHPPCIDIPEDKVDMLDAYICKSCERLTKQHTKWKAMCKRSGCSKALPPLATKFCSQLCAFKHAQSLIGDITDRRKRRQLASELVAFPEPHASVKVVHHLDSDSAPTSGADTAQDVLQQYTEQVQAAIELVRARQAILQQAIARCEALIQANGHDTAMDVDEPRPKKSKSKSSSKSDDRICGWDSRLTADDWEILDLVASGEKVEACMVARRRCDRHQGWQKTIAASLEVEAHCLVCPTALRDSSRNAG